MLRNREFRRFALLFLAIAAATAVLGFAIDPAAGILATGASAVFGAAFLVFTKARYQRLGQISDQIDRVLHNADQLDIGGSEEGELSILCSEITKMTLRIREQNEALRKEKEHLADSLADVAHQLRTPLTSANLTLALLAGQSDENQRKALARETEALLLRMDWLLTSLLKISRLDAGIVEFKKERTEVKALVSDALRPLLIPMELHGIDLRIEVQGGIWIQADSGWLSEAVQNIIKNCMESAGENGKIEVVCTDTALYTEITVRDNGSGFQKEDLLHLFDRFYRGKNAGAAGYGIGLALSKMIITRQGGTVAARNHPQGGAVFAIRFPK